MKKTKTPQPVIICTAELIWSVDWMYHEKVPTRSQRTFTLVDNGGICIGEYSTAELAEIVHGRDVTYTPPINNLTFFLDGYFGREPILSEVYALTPLSRRKIRDIRHGMESGS